MQVHEQNPVAADTIPFEGIVTATTYLFGLLGALAGICYNLRR